MPRRCSLLLACATALLATPLSACKKDPPTSVPGATEDQVDHVTRDLLMALTAADRDRALALSNAALAIELDERSVAILGRTLSWLGPISKLAKADETPVSGGIERRYRVGFQRDELTLVITVVGGKVEGFEFDEGQWDALSKRATEALTESLHVAEFTFISREGEVLSEPYEPGELEPEALGYRLTLEGLDAQLREHHVAIGKSVVDDQGNQVYRQRKDDEFRFSQAETGSIGGRIEGGFGVPGPGTYTLELTITDVVAGESITHEVPLTID